MPRERSEWEGPARVALDFGLHGVGAGDDSEKAVLL
jgi:hypothetical protein